MARKEYSDIAATTTLVGNLAIGGLSFTIAASTGWPAGTYQFVVKIEDELILCSARSGTTLTVASGGRGHSGTTAIAHSNGAPVKHVWESASATDFQRHVYDVSHDDHTQYQKESEKNQNNGYAGLDSSGLVADARIAATIARDSEVTSAVSSGITTHNAAVDPHGDRAAAVALVDDLSGVTNAPTARTNLGLGTAAVTNTGTGATNTILGNDARLTDTRVPTDGSVTEAKLATGYHLTYLGSSAPPSPFEGQLWYEDDTDILWAYGGVTWYPVSASVLSTYTPTLRQGGSAVGKTTTQCRYSQHGGRKVEVQMGLAITSSGGTGTVDVSLPVNHTATINTVCGGIYVLDASGPTSYVGAMLLNGSDATKATADFSTLIPTFPQLANTDTVSIQLAYLI
jgi:hypothetical protein